MAAAFHRSDPAEALRIALYSGAIVGTWEYDNATRRFTGDDGYARALALDFSHGDGWRPVEDFIAITHPDDFPSIVAAVLPAIESGGAYSVEFRVRRPDGGFRWLQSAGRPHLTADGSPAHFSGVLIDIDERKRTEERLRRSEADAREANALLQAVIEAVPALIYVKDRDGRMMVANAPVMELVGKPWAHIINRTDAEFLDDQEQAARIMATDRRVMEAAAGEQVEEVVGRDAIGPRIWLSHKTAFRNQDGQVVGLVGTSVDITERKRAEQAAAASEARLRRVLDNLFVFVGILDLDGRLLEANRAPVEGAGLNFADVIGEPFCDAYWWSHDPAARARIIDATERGRAGLSSRFDVEIRWRDDSRLVIDFQMAPLRDERGDVVQLVPSAVDITARKQAEAQRQTLIMELNHRLKNLFMVACGMVDMTARRARTPAEMAQALTGRLMALARAHELIAPAVVGAGGGGHGAALHDLLAAVVAPHLAVDSDQLRTEGRNPAVASEATTALALVLHELATNSAKYGALSRPEGRLDLACRDAGDTVVITWSESGGPPVSRPSQEGFGSRLIRSTVIGQLRGTIAFDWAATGLVATLTVARERLEG